MFKKINFYIVSAYYAFIFMAGGGYYAFIGLYYKSINISKAQIGIIASLGALVGILAQPLWGTLSDRAKNKTMILQIMNFISAGLIWLIPLSGNDFIILILATAVIQFFLSSINPMGDSITIEISKKENFKFSVIRFIGSAGFAIMAGIGGKIVSIDIKYIFLMFFILRICSGFISFFIPKVEGHKKEGNKNFIHDFVELFKDRRLNTFYIYAFIISVTAGFFNTFHPLYSDELKISKEMIGLGVMIGSFSQFPFMVFFDWFYKRLGIIKIMVISGFIYALRWFLYVTVLSTHTILFIWAIHGMTFIILYLCLADYVALNVPEKLKTRGQMMNNIVLLGASSIAGSSLGGFISHFIGLKYTFLICAILCLLTIAGFIIAVNVFPEFKKKDIIPGDETETGLNDGGLKDTVK